MTTPTLPTDALPTEVSERIDALLDNATARCAHTDDPDVLDALAADLRAAIVSALGRARSAGEAEARRAERAAHQILAAVVLAAGGEVRVHSETLLLADQLTVSRAYAPHAAQEVFRAWHPRIPPSQPGATPSERDGAGRPEALAKADPSSSESP